MYHSCARQNPRTGFATVDAKLKNLGDIQKLINHVFRIGSDDDHVHFLVQSVPVYSPKQIVEIIKSITA